MKQARPRGRRPLETPRPLLLALARLMLDRRISRWRAACEVAESEAGRGFAARAFINSSKDVPSLAKRLDRCFAPHTRSLLAEAGRLNAATRNLETARAMLNRRPPGFDAAMQAIERAEAQIRLSPQMRAAIEMQERCERDLRRAAERLQQIEDAALRPVRFLNV